MMNAYPRWSLLAVPLLVGLGCSDPVPPPAQAAVSLGIGQPLTQVNGMSCPVIHTYHVGAFDSKTMKTLAPTTTDPGQSLISGESGSTISCSVTGGGGNFKFAGSIHATTDEGDLISVSFANGSVTGSATGTADVSVYTPELSANFSSPTTMPCTFQILMGSNGPQIKGGSMWASFACPSISSPPSGLCGILQASSVVVLENCSAS